MRRLCFYELFDADLFYNFMSVGEIATWFSGIEKGGLFLNRTEQNKSIANNIKAFMW